MMSFSALTPEVIFLHLVTALLIRLLFGIHVMTQSNHMYTTPLYKLTLFQRCGVHAIGLLWHGF